MNLLVTITILGFIGFAAFRNRVEHLQKNITQNRVTTIANASWEDDENLGFHNKGDLL